MSCVLFLYIFILQAHSKCISICLLISFSFFFFFFLLLLVASARPHYEAGISWTECERKSRAERGRHVATGWDDYSASLVNIKRSTPMSVGRDRKIRHKHRRPV